MKERIKKFIEYKKMPTSTFEKACGMSNGYISSMRKGLGSEKIENVLKAFPELNRIWLLTGEGDMLSNNSHHNSFNVGGDGSVQASGGSTIHYNNSEKVDELKKRIEELENDKKELQKDKETLQKVIEFLTNKNQ